MNTKNKIDIRNILYVLYVCTYNDDLIEIEDLNWLLIKSFGYLDPKISSKELLIKKLTDFLKANQLYTENEMIKFKIGDLIKTNISSSLIELQFLFEKINNKDILSVFENNNKICIIPLKY